MLQMRKNVFETNSSSTHSITMCTEDEYNAWANGDVLLNDGWWGKDNTSEFKNKKFVTREEAEDIIRHHAYHEPTDELSGLSDEEFDEYCYDMDYGLYSMNKYFENEYLEWFDEKYTTPSGETVVAFGLYGTDYQEIINGSNSRTC